MNARSAWIIGCLNYDMGAKDRVTVVLHQAEIKKRGAASHETTIIRAPQGFYSVKVDLVHLQPSIAAKQRFIHSFTSTVKVLSTGELSSAQYNAALQHGDHR